MAAVCLSNMIAAGKDKVGIVGENWKRLASTISPLTPDMLDLIVIRVGCEEDGIPRVGKARLFP